MFMKIAKAYEALTDPQVRAIVCRCCCCGCKMGTAAAATDADHLCMRAAAAGGLYLARVLVPAKTTAFFLLPCMD